MSEQRMHKVEFLTDGVTNLRPILKNDLDFLLAIANNQRLRRTLGGFLPMTEYGEEEWMKSLANKKESDIVFIIEVDDKPIGIMGIHKINWKDRLATTGAAIKDEGNCGKGYGTRAKMLLLHYAFHECNLHKICSTSIHTNIASLRFNEKCGYRVEGVLKKHIFKDGDYQDLVQTAVFREGFDPIWKEWKEKYKLGM